jgi:hypothetical protein
MGRRYFFARFFAVFFLGVVVARAAARFGAFAGAGRAALFRPTSSASKALGHASFTLHFPHSGLRA